MFDHNFHSIYLEVPKFTVNTFSLTGYHSLLVPTFVTFTFLCNFCFTSVSVANCFPARCILRGPKSWKSLGERWKLQRGWFLVTNMSNWQYGRISLSLDPERSTYLASTLQQTLTTNRLSTPSYRNKSVVTHFLKLPCKCDRMSYIHSAHSIILSLCMCM